MATNNSSFDASFIGKKYNPIELKREIESLPKHLPAVDNEERARFDKLFAKFGIADTSGILGRIESDKVNETYLISTLNEHIIHMQKFLTAMKRFFSAAPIEYQNMVGKANNTQLRVFQALATWDIATASEELKQLEFDIKEIYIEKMIPLVYMLYRPIMQLLFLGEVGFSTLVDKTYAEIKEQSTVATEDLFKAANEAKNEWGFIYNKVVLNLYPILMRICSSYCVSMQDFLNDNILRILNFLNLKKSDIILPTPFEKVKFLEESNEESATSLYAQRSQSKELLVQNGLTLLNRLFPEVGFRNLTARVDFYPYFQPLFNFTEGFNLLSPENPMQVVVVLLRVTEDLLAGCSSIHLKDVKDDNPHKMTTENFYKASNDWYLARMNVFEKDYCQKLGDYVNRIYSKKEFKTSAIGMKMLSSIAKVQKREFFPHFKYAMGLIDNETTAFGSLPVFKKISQLAKHFNYLAENVNEALKASGGKSTGKVAGIENPWERFIFTIENPTSQRLTTLLGGKNSLGITNANLITSIAQIFAVLDWWVNNPKSPAYATEIENFYRCDTLSGEPIFSAPLRNDVDYVFIRENKKR